MVDRYPGEPFWPSGDMLVRPLLNLGIAILVFGFAVYLLAKYLPKTSFYHRIVLAASTPSGPGITIPASRLIVAVGMTGVARTTLRPSGKADFEGHVVDVISQGDYLREGSPVKVIAVEGPRVVVEGR
jgi:membrane-bound serine protease (ClpP class)